jgi:steroid delta-isomerase-like uncharacterized protein
MKLRLIVLGMLALVLGLPPIAADAGEADNKAIVRRFYAEINRGNTSIIDELVAARFTDEEFRSGQRAVGRTAMKEAFAMLRATFPDARVQVEDLIGEGDKVVARVTVTGTHRGALRGGPHGDIRPTGKKVTLRGIEIYQIGDGKIVGLWSAFDSLDLMQQLGAVRLRGSQFKAR